MYTTIIDALTLHEHFKDPNWVIVDCRFNLQDSDAGFEEYKTEHIPSAVYADLEKDLSGRITAQSGKHPLPQEPHFRELISRLGIDSDKQVIVYDTATGEYAARLWWLLGLYNHQNVAVLDGGFAQWKAKRYPVASGNETNVPTQFSGTPDLRKITTSVQIETYLYSPVYRLVDSRIPERFRGEFEPIYPVAGHIPSAVNHSYISNLNPDNTFLPAETLRKNLAQIIQNTSPANVIIYCGSGVTACVNMLALKISGIEGPRLYAGSWSEWIKDSRREIEKG